MKTIKQYHCEIIDDATNKDIWLPETPQIGAIIYQDKILYKVIGVKYWGGEHSGYKEIKLMRLK